MIFKSYAKPNAIIFKGFTSISRLNFQISFRFYKPIITSPFQINSIPRKGLWSTQEYKDSIQNYLGASCEVLKLDNQLLFAGSIHQYDDIEDEITISIRNGNETPQGIVYHTPVKLHVRTNISMNKVLLLYGLVSRCAADF